MKKTNKILLFCLLSLLMIAIDQGTKQLAKIHLKGKEPLSYWNDMARLEYIENTGAFLSLGENWSYGTSLVVFTILPLIFLAGIFIYAIRQAKQLSFTHMLPFALICSGGVGNIIDRLLYDRHVTDFMNLGIGNLRTGIFNVADMYVSAGVIMMLVFSFKERKKQKAG